MTKIVDLLEECRAEGETCVSFEFFPTNTKGGEDALFQRIAEMTERLKPKFISLTWRSAFKDESVWLKIGSMVQKQLGIDVLLHLTCHLPRLDLIRVLRNARAAGIENILALRGDSAHFTAGQQPGGEGKSSKWRACSDGFKNAIELVHLIRAEHGDHFCIGVAGYPEVHTSCWNSEYLPPSDQARDLDLQRLKDKVDAGADFVITQFVYDMEVFFTFQKRCREIGIKVPIIPGYAPIQNYSSFQKFRSWVKPKVPPEVSAKLAKIKDNDEDVREFGVDVAVEQCGTLLRGDVPAIHFFTLNLGSSVASILKRLHLRDLEVKNRELPFRGIIRDREEVRPIFWAHRHSSYLSRTSTWEEFPNGRWGGSRSAATFELADYYLAEKKRNDVDALKMWGTPQNVSEVAQVFVKYMRGEITQLPWCDEGLALETDTIAESLYWINKHGFLTINSQPKVNGVASSDKRFGWGGQGGVCFQKAYVEFFCPPELWFKLRDAMHEAPFLGRLSYHAINFSGDEFLDSVDDVSVQTGVKPTRSESIKMRKSSIVEELLEEKESHPGRVNAVTWAVFPGREIIQPTVVDTESFRVWKDEAFELWLTQWASLYAAEEASGIVSEERQQAVKVLREIHDTWFLVNIVDNDYVSETSDIFDVFKKVILDDMSPKQLRDRVDLLEKENAYLFRELLRAQSQLEKLTNKTS